MRGIDFGELLHAVDARGEDPRDLPSMRKAGGGAIVKYLLRGRDDGLPNNATCPRIFLARRKALPTTSLRSCGAAFGMPAGPGAD
jgi:hypothetical protein